MGRYKFRVRLSKSRESGLPNETKRDTPVKTALSRREIFSECRRFLPNRHYEAFPEEPEVEEMNVLTVKPANPVLTDIKHVHSKSVLHLSSPAFANNPRGKALSHAATANTESGYKVSPAGHPSSQMTRVLKTFKGGEMPVKEEEQNLAVTPKSTTSSSMETDATFSSDDDEEEEDCYSSASTSSSSLPSPEIFRKESYVETLTFPIKEEQLGLQIHIKNSTLLDVSHAEGIHMHPPPNLSTILDASEILAENNCEMNQHRGTKSETKLPMDPFNSEEAFKWKTSPKVKTSCLFTNRRPILYKKKVWFKSPITAETFKAKDIPATTLTVRIAREPVQMSSPAEQMKPGTDASRASEITSVEEALCLMVALKKPVKCPPEKAKFFDFVNDSERDAYFQRMRERCDKLRNAPLFPLTAAKPTESSVL